jgi:hypothetical protein
LATPNKVLNLPSQNKNEDFRKRKIRCPEGATRRLGIRSAAITVIRQRFCIGQEFFMSAIAYALSRTFRLAGEADNLTQIALFCGVGLLVSLVCLSYGLDLSPGFF